MLIVLFVNESSTSRLNETTARMFWFRKTYYKYEPSSERGKFNKGCGLTVFDSSDHRGSGAKAAVIVGRNRHSGLK